MAPPRQQDVWLHGVHVGLLSERRTGKLQLEYTEEAAARWPPGRLVLSIALPMKPDRRHTHAATTPYFEGLLPEGMARGVLEDRFDVRRGDTYGLLQAIGRDCAGAVVIQPPGESQPEDRHQITGQPLDPADVAAELDNLSTFPLGAGRDVRVSLAGQQDKLLLTQAADGTWLRPTGRTPSTHILKPQDERFPGSVLNEALCLRLAHNLELTNVDVDVLAHDRPVLVVSRYDRQRHEDGAISRVHQEDMCQALSVVVDVRGEAKYQSGGGPSLIQIARILDTYGHDQPTQLDRLLRVMTFNVVIGNADAHGKNLSVLHRSDGTIELAPLYDVMSTVHYRDVPTAQGRMPISTDLAMTVNGVEHIHAVTVEDLIAECAEWHVSRTSAASTVTEMLDQLPTALDRAAAQTPDAHPEIVALVRSRTAALRSGRPAGPEV